MDDYENLPLQEPVGVYYRDWTMRRGKRVRYGWPDDLCDKRGGSSKMFSWGREKNTKRRTLRSHRDGSARRWSRLLRHAPVP